jgi:hypothetical protein
MPVNIGPKHKFHGIAGQAEEAETYDFVARSRRFNKIVGLTIIDLVREFL